jgi:hypothetical protein
MGHVHALADAARENQCMSATISEWLLNTGILQFGSFFINRKFSPVRFCPEYLPSYPQLLTEVGKLALSKLNISEVDHLLATADSVPLGLVCSLQSNLSLVYSRGKGETAVFDLVGSYNSGHKSALLINCVDVGATIEIFIANARSVGLEVDTIVVLLEMRSADQLAGIPFRSVFRLVDVVQELVARGRLSAGQSQAVLSWIDELKQP